jgi:SAM-dependent methyltransferase
MDILSSIKIEEIYRFNLKSLQDISKFLGTWHQLSDEEKSELIELDKPAFEKKLSHLSKEEMSKKLNDPEFWEEYNDKFVYGEISKDGVNNLANYLQKYSGIFYDIGSGNGKLLIHLSLITNFDKYIGGEIIELRHKYALKINEKIGQNVTFICDDVLNLDISDANFIFLDDLMFPRDLRTKILKKIPYNCLYISVWKNDEDELIENFKIAVTWLEKEMDFYLYKKR